MVTAIPSSARILVVDDEEANVDLLEQMLARAGYSAVVGTTDSRKALSLYAEHQPDLILLDLVMPHLDGFAVMEQVRATLGPESYLPIVVLTADATPETRRRALDCGATDFLTKPFDQIELLLRVRNLLQTRFLHRRLEEQVTRLTVLYEEARRTLELRAQQFAAVGHDLGQPLSSMRLTAQLLQRTQASERGEANRAAQVATFEPMINRMLGMVGEILDLSRIEAGRPLDFDYRRVDLVALVRAEVEAQQQLTGRHAISLDAEPEEVVGELDPVRIGRVIANVLSNAVKYSPSGSGIAVSVAAEGVDWASITVKDEGLGIPAADLPLLFEPFVRGSNVAGRIAGSGLGLAGARRIVEQHGGTIAIDSVEGSGTTVTVRIPLA
jgi:two-component system sensor histidine kinase/response regulator